MKRRYGFLGFISLIGLLGLIEKNADFYPFLAFILFFQYLFVQPDEMFVENMRKAAAWAFYANLTAATNVTPRPWPVFPAAPGRDAPQRPGSGYGRGLWPGADDFRFRHSLV